MKVAAIKETFTGEKRVALTPEVCGRIIKLGYQVVVEAGAGNAASYYDQEYKQAGAEIANSAQEAIKDSDIILKVRAPALTEINYFRPGQTVLSFIWPAQNPDLMQALAHAKINVLAMDCVPRISRAQKLDALSSMANIAGYRAVVEAAQHFGRFFTGQVTAAGKVPPAKVLVIGAGVAGLAAIGTAGALGAVVRAFDTRPEVKEQVASMGAEFLELDYKEEGSGTGGYAKVMSEAFIAAEMKLFAEQAKEVDIIITTALIPGKKAPTLITAQMVQSMRPGSVVVDLAAEQGGNCEMTVPGEVSVRRGVSIIGYTDLPSRMAGQSSQLYGTNLWRLLEDMTPKKDGSLIFNMEDEVVRATTVIHKGEVIWPPPPPPPPIAKAPVAAAVSAAPVGAAHGKVAQGSGSYLGSIILFGLLGGLFLLVGLYAPAAFLSQFTVFVLSCFVGYMVVWNVTAALHTPLMSVTNAISGIIAIGALVQASSDNTVVRLLAGLAILISMINIAGGFLVTERMLKMFRK